MECFSRERKGKGRFLTGLFLSSCEELGVNRIHRAGIYASAAVDTGISIDSTFVTRFTDSVNRAGFVTCAAVNAFFGNSVGQDFHLLLYNFLSSCLNYGKLAYGVGKVQHKGFFNCIFPL